MKKLGILGLVTLGIACVAIPLSIVLASGGTMRGGSGVRPKYILNGNPVSGINDEWFEYYDIGGGNYAIGLKEGKKGTLKNDGFDIPERKNNHPITGIYHNGFHGNPTTRITLPETLKTIDFEAFLYSGITTITIPSSVTRIGDSAFYSCNSLTNVTFLNSAEQSSDTQKACDCEVPSPSTSSSSSQDSSASSSQELSSSSESSSSSLPSSEATSGLSSSSSQSSSSSGGDSGPLHLTVIPSFCFFKCRNLTSVSFPAHVEEIQQEAFRGCENLSSSIFFQSIKYIRARAFEGCFGLRSVFISSSLFDDPNGDGIEPHAFNNCNPDLIFTFSGDQSTNYKDIKDWESNHPYWGWYNDYGDPLEDSYKNDENRLMKSGSVHYSNEWAYSIDSNNNVRITEYTGETKRKEKNAQGEETENLVNITSITIPSTINDYPGSKVRWIDASALNKIKAQLTRVYLPKTLWIIEANMFDNSYTNLKVIADGSQCLEDQKEGTGEDSDSLIARIDIHKLDELEFIGNRAFIMMPKRNDIKKVHLPAAIRAIGDEAFGISYIAPNTTGEYHFQKVETFVWDYDEEKSRLEVIGNDAFFKFGVDDNQPTIKTENFCKLSHRAVEAAEIIFPRTLRYFGLLKVDITRYRTNPLHPENPYFFGDFEDNGKRNRPGHTFGGSPMLKTVVFKGDKNDSSKTSDLILPVQAFASCPNLQTVIFEERLNHYITFHTQNGDYGEPVIGGTSGLYKNDFRGDSGLQTLVLPNKYTHLRIQSKAFAGSARLAIYFTGAENSNLHGCNVTCDNNSGNGHWPKLVNPETGAFLAGTDTIKGKDNKDATIDCDISDIREWNIIGYEEKYVSGGDANNKYWGYNLKSNNNNDTLFLKQYIPLYYNVHYKGTMSAYKNGKVADIEIETGDSNSSEELVIDSTGAGRSKCAYVCHYDSSQTPTHTAIMSKYLYNLWDTLQGESLATARVPEKITAKHNGVEFECTVTEIGDSAFSAAYCDGKGQPTGNPDLTTVLLPNSIERIGDYAFMRAYGVNKISSYTTSEGVDTEDAYAMPESLDSIGKYGLAFCGLTKVKKIPANCKFFENYHNPSGADDADKAASVFTNDIDLRTITFMKNGIEGDSSNYYYATSYTSKTNSEKRTTAIYSNNAAANNQDTYKFQYNKNRLLLVLFRTCNGNKADKLNEDSLDTEKYTVRINEQTVDNRIKFKGAAINFDNNNALVDGPNSNPFLFGAYKMAMWIDWLEAGGADTSIVSKQPLFSGIYERKDGEDLKLSKIYLSYSVSNYAADAIKCDLKTVSGKLLEFPQYAFSGCEKLEKVVLPNAYGNFTSLPAGLFNGVSGDKVVYATEYTEAQGTTEKGLLDLTGTGYTGIGEDTFKNNLSLERFIAPSTDNFKVGANAFSGCENLVDVSFASINTKLELLSNAFYKTGLTAITTDFWPANQNCEVRIDKDGTFSQCDSLVSVVIPIKTNDQIGKNCFAGCDLLANVVVGNGTTDVNSYITTFNEGAFSSCPALSNFHFDQFDVLNKLGKKAFYQSGTSTNSGIMDSGNVVIGTNLANSDTQLEIGAGAFSETGVVTLRIQSKIIQLDYDGTIKGAIYNNSSLTDLIIDSSTIKLQQESCSNNSSLARIRFTCENATWSQYNNGVFKNNPSLVELQLPSEFNLQSNTQIINGDINVSIYTYMSAKDFVGKTYGTWKTTGGGDPTIYFFAKDAATMRSDAIYTNSGLDSKFETRAFWALDGEASVALGTVDKTNSNFNNANPPCYVAFHNDKTSKDYLLFEDGTIYQGSISDWLDETYSIIVDLNGGTGATNKSYSYDDSSAQTVTLDTPTREGYTFAGWQIVSGPVYKTATITSNVTLNLPVESFGNITVIAGWEPISYIISFNKNANDATGSTASMSIDYDETQSLTANGFTREAYVFVGWSTTSNGDVIYLDQASVSNLSSTDGATVELFAIWTYGVNHGVLGQGGWVVSKMEQSTENIPEGYTTQYEIILHLNAGEAFGIKLMNGTWLSYGTLDSGCNYLFTNSGGDAVARFSGTYHIFLKLKASESEPAIWADIEEHFTISGDMSTFESWDPAPTNYWVHVWNANDSGNPYVGWKGDASSMARSEDNVFTVNVKGEGSTYNRAIFLFYQNGATKQTRDLEVSLSEGNEYVITVGEVQFGSGDEANTIVSGITISLAE